jgi:23S rRNA pseudouridine955/2504/2580 synthase
MKELGKAPKVVRHVVDIEEAGQRIDNFLIRLCKGVPKSHVYRVLRSGEVRVNGGRVAQTYRLIEKDEVRIPPMRLAEPGAPAPVPVREFDILYEDDAFLALNKPAGMAVHGGSGVSFGVIESLRRARPQARLLELAHRLDRETSGILLVAKKRSALTALHDAFRDGGMEKHYWAVVSGRWMNPLQHIRLALTKYLTESGERRVSVDSEGKTAHSIVRLETRWPQFSLLDVHIKTGRTHQIRVHLSASGFPIVGDEKYGDFALNKMLRKNGLPRMFLHAHSLALKHPLTGAALRLEASLPDDLAGFVLRIDQQQAREFERKDHDAPAPTGYRDGPVHARTV